MKSYHLCKGQKNLIKKALLFLTLINLTHFSFSQNSDSTKLISHFSGAVSVTNKGISTIPSFTLGKPAVIFDLSIGKGNLSFEPQLRFALEGKHWSFLFWWRYKLLNNDKFLINIGAYPALSCIKKQFFKNQTLKSVFHWVYSSILLLKNGQARWIRLKT